MAIGAYFRPCPASTVAGFSRPAQPLELPLETYRRVLALASNSRPAASAGNEPVAWGLMTADHDSTGLDGAVTARAVSAERGERGKGDAPGAGGSANIQRPQHPEPIGYSGRRSDVFVATTDGAFCVRGRGALVE